MPQSRSPLGALVVALDVHTYTTLGEFFDLLLEAGLDGVEHLLVPLAADEGDGDTLRTETTGTTDTVKVCVGSLGQ